RCSAIRFRRRADAGRLETEPIGFGAVRRPGSLHCLCSMAFILSSAVLAAQQSEDIMTQDSVKQEKQTSALAIVDDASTHGISLINQLGSQQPGGAAENGPQQSCSLPLRFIAVDDESPFVRPPEAWGFYDEQTRKRESNFTVRLH